jgi:diadenosine tetraphosphatase ApaH/serine/threonine PP2A family protein phosphatase
MILDGYNGLQVCRQRRDVYRFQVLTTYLGSDVPDYGLLNDLVWSDPSDTALEWEDNERGVSYCYGKAVINSFLATHVSQII